MLDVFFYEAFKEEEEHLKKYLPEGIKTGFTYHTVQEYGKKEVPAKIISIRTQSRIPTPWINNISGILSRSSGFDHIQKYAKQIVCGYLPLYCSRAVAEQVIILAMSLLRKLPKQIKQFSDFNRNGLTGSEAKGKKIVIVGVGNIGYEIYKIAKNMGIEAFGADILKKHNDVNYISIEKGIKLADILVCSMNLTKENHSYFDYKLLEKSKKGLIFINIARGEMSPAIDLLRLINKNHLGGLALDVYNKESILGESLRTGIIKDNEEIKSILELHKKEQVILTPHNSFNTKEAVDRKASQSVQQIEYFFKNNKFLWEVPTD